MNRDEIISMAREAGIIAGWAPGVGYPNVINYLTCFAAFATAAERTRADALAATIQALCQIVTTDHESKAAFIARVSAVLSKCPDTRVLRAVEAEREACAKVCRDRYDEGMAGHEALDCEALILARGKA